MADMSFLAAADTVNMQAGGDSFFDRFGMAVTAGAASAAVSGLHSLYNTGVELSNTVFGTELERADTLQTISDFDANWGSYYQENREAIDLAGFIGTSLIPGGLAVKGLKLVQRGESAGALGRVLRYTTKRESFYLKEAIKDLTTEGGTIFTRINANKLKSMAWGAADNVLQAATFEAAVAMTMKQSPMLENEDWSKIGWDIVKTSMLGGVIGGTINGLITNRTIKEVGKDVERRSRAFDTLKEIGDVDVSFGDKAFGIINAVTELPDEVIASVAKLNAAGETFDLTKMLERKLADTGKHGMERFQQQITEVVKNDHSVGQPVAMSFLKIVDEGVEKGLSKETIRAKLGDYLFGLKAIESVGTGPTDLSKGLVYFTPKSKLGDVGASLFSATKQEGDQAFRLLGDVADMKVATLGKEALTTKQAWEAGFDVALDPHTQQLTVSPFSKIVQKLNPEDADDLWLFYNTKTGQTADTMLPTIADIATQQAALRVTPTSVSAGNRSFVQSLGGYKPDMTSLEVTARHAWAASPDGLKLVTGVVNARDFSVLDAMMHGHAKFADDVVIKLAGGGELPVSAITDLRNFVFKQKNELLQEILAKGPVDDLRDLALKLNVEPQWLQRAVETKLSTRALYDDPGWMRDPKDFLSRENVVFRYNRPVAETTNSDALIAWHTRVKEAQDRSRISAKAVLGELHDMLLDIKPGQTLTAEASQVGNGATFLGASNANYNDTLGVWAQNTGVAFQQISERLFKPLSDELQAPAARLLANPESAAEVSAIMTKIRTSADPLSLTKHEGRWMLVDTDSLKKVRKGEYPAYKEKFDVGDDAGDFLATFQKQHNDWIEKDKVLKSAAGTPTHFDPDVLYLPPIDTKRFPYFAFVRQTEGRVFGSSDTAMITARNAQELQAKIAQIQKMDGMEVVTKADAERFHKAKGDYDYQRAMNSSQVDSMLKKEGLLGDMLPNMTPEAIIEDFITFTKRRTDKLARDAITTNYSQQIAELEDLSQRASRLETSTFGGLFKKQPKDPFGDYIKTALGISKKSEFTLWHQANEFVDALGVRAYQALEKGVLDARQGKLSWEDANKQLDKFGIGKVFQDEDMFRVAQTGTDRSLFRLAIQKANSLLATATLRLDWANSLMNIVSTPILLGTEVKAIRSSLTEDPELLTAFNKQLREVVPDGKGTEIPSVTRLLFNAVRNLTGESKKELLERYKKIGAIKGELQAVHEMYDDLALTPNLVPTEWSKKVDKWVDRASRVTFSNQAEEYTRFVSADVMRQITEPLRAAGKMSETEQNAFIQIFTNRVQGNYVAAQRPILFQGVLGSAIGLFQTYQFNVLQQLFRHVGDKNLAATATFAGLQGSFFGLNGLPFFDAINTHIIGSASINEGHKDLYGAAVNAFGKDLGDWMMYGTASAFPLFSDKAPALYTRGDLNPRTPILIPTSFADVPAVSGSIRAVSAVLSIADQVKGGASIKDALLFGMEHNGINRPLAGIAQLMKGSATTSRGELIASQADMNSIASLSRILGARPMDEAVGVSERYRSKVYQAMDKEKIERLGQVIKDKIRSGEEITSEDWYDLQSRYAAAGGRVQGFGAAVRRWDRDAKISVINSAMQHNDTLQGRRMIEVMGGEGVEDLTTPQPLPPLE